MKQPELKWMPSDVYFGDPDQPLPNWREEMSEEQGDDDAEASEEEVAAVSAVLGFDVNSLDEESEEEDEPAIEKSLPHYANKGEGTCERGQRSDLTGCTPASGEVSNSSSSDSGDAYEQWQERQTARDTKRELLEQAIGVDDERAEKVKATLTQLGSLEEEYKAGGEIDSVELVESAANFFQLVNSDWNSGVELIREAGATNSDLKNHLNFIKQATNKINALLVSYSDHLKKTEKINAAVRKLMDLEPSESHRKRDDWERVLEKWTVRQEKSNERLDSLSTRLQEVVELADERVQNSITEIADSISARLNSEEEGDSEPNSESGEKHYKAAGTCKQGERADVTGCIPATRESEPESAPSPEVKTSPKQRIIAFANATWEKLQQWGHSAQDVEHAMKEWVSNKIEERIAKLPEKLQKAVKGTWLALRFGTKAIFATYIAGQKMAESVAKERGYTPEQADRLKSILSSVDIATFKPVSIGVGLVAGPVVAGAGSFLPIGSMTYLAYSTARDPLATVRAAQKAVSNLFRTQGQQAENKAMDAEKMGEIIGEVGDWLHEEGDEEADYRQAILLSTLDRAKDLPEALCLAKAATKGTYRVKELRGFKLKESTFTSYYRKAAGTCKQGERSDLTGCTPATGDVSARKRPKQEEQSSQRQRGEQEQPKRERPLEAEQKKEVTYAPPPEGENIAPTTCCLYDVDPTEVDENTGVTKAARVGVPAMDVPPPPSEIPQLPNLTESERAAESQFAEAFLADPDGVAKQYRDALASRKIGDAPNIFNTDDAKLLSPSYNPEGEDQEANKSARGVYNVAVHQTANAIAKRAFLQYLDEVVSELPEDQKTVLVTSGGVASGKGYALQNVDETKSIASQVGAIWDAAGEQNATENPWVLEECKKRGIKPIFAFINADPMQTWENPARGVVERANKIGRMVDARVFADSYAIGAKNFQAFHEKYKGEADFFILDNSKGKPQRVDKVPEGVLSLDVDDIYKRASAVLAERADKLRPSVVRGGSIGQRIWGV